MIDESLNLRLLNEKLVFVDEMIKCMKERLQIHREKIDLTFNMVKNLQGDLDGRVNFLQAQITRLEDRLDLVNEYGP